MATVGTLAVNVVARTDKFVRGINQSRTMLGSLSSSLARTSKMLAGFGIGAAAAGGAVGAYMVKQQFTAVDALGKTADKLGISTEKLAAYHLAAEETGAGVSVMNTGLEKMVIRISEAAQGTGEAVGALKELGLSASVLNRLSPDQQFERIAAAMQGVERHTDKVRLAYELFGRSGTALVNTLALGKDGLADVESFATKAGLTISRDMARAIERANDAFNRMKQAIVGIARQIAVRVAPLIEAASKKLTAFITDDGRVRSFADALAKGLGSAIAMVIRGMHEVRKIALQVVASVAGFIKSLSQSEGFIRAMSRLGISGDQIGDMGQAATGIYARSRFALSQANQQDPAAKFLLWFNKHLDKALETTMPEAPATKLADRIKESLAPLLAFADRFKSRYASFYGGVFAQVQRLFGAGGDAAAGGALASPASLAFARTGSVDSYRQRRRIERQGSDSLPAIAKKQVSVLEGIRGVMEEVKEGLGGMLKPANLFE